MHTHTYTYTHTHRPTHTYIFKANFLIFLSVQDGVRELQLKDLDTTSSDFVQFYLRIAGGDWRCRGAEQRSQSVLLQFSVDGGIQWQLLEELLHTDYQTPRYFSFSLLFNIRNQKNWALSSTPIHTCAHACMHACMHTPTHTISVNWNVLTLING